MEQDRESFIANIIELADEFAKDKLQVFFAEYDENGRMLSIDSLKGEKAGQDCELCRIFPNRKI